MGQLSAQQQPLPAAIRIPALKFHVGIIDQATGQPLITAPPTILEKIHWCLVQDAWELHSVTVTATGDWALRIMSGGVKHQLVFDSETVKAIMPDSAVFDRIYQIVEQLAAIRLKHKFLELRKGLYTNDD